MPDPNDPLEQWFQNNTPGGPTTPNNPGTGGSSIATAAPGSYADQQQQFTQPATGTTETATAAPGVAQARPPAPVPPKPTPADEPANKSLSVTELLTAFNKGKMSREDVDKALQGLGYLDKGTRDTLFSISAKAPTLDLGQMGRAFDSKTLDQKGVYDRLAQAGYSKEDQDILFKQMVAPAKSLSESQALKLYSEKTISRDELTQRLTAEGYGEKDIPLIINQADRTDLISNKMATAPQGAKSFVPGVGYKDAAGMTMSGPEGPDTATPAARQPRPQAAPREPALPRQPAQRTSQQFVNEFHDSYLDQLRTAGLGSGATKWLMNNMDIAMNEHLKTGNGQPHEGGVLSPTALATLYEGSRGRTPYRDAESNPIEAKAI